MRKLTVVLTATLAMLFFALPALAATYHTITIDGDLSDWAADELMEQDAGSDLYITWDADSLYIALNNIDWGSAGDLFVYLDVATGGSTTSENWNGTHTLPFGADYVFAVENGYHNLRRYTGGAWVIDQPYNGSNFLGWSGDQDTEIELPWTDILTPTANLGVLVFVQNENDQGVWASWPTPNPANGSGSETFTHYYHFPSLVDGMSPDDSVLANHLIINEFVPKGTEWIELYNPTTATVSLTGWYLSDGEGTDTLAGTVLAGGYLVTPTNNIALSNDGDEIMLYAPGDVLVDQVAFGMNGSAPIAPTGDSTARTPNGTDTDDNARDWTLDQTPTSGTGNDAPEVDLGSSLIINEINNYTPGDDALEFYNPLTASIPITGWLLSDGDGWGTIITTGVAPVGGWLVVDPNDYGVYFSSDDVAYLFRPDGIRVEQIGWSGEYEDYTFQRIPDGAGPNDGYDWDSSGGDMTLFDMPPTLNYTNNLSPSLEIGKEAPSLILPGDLLTYTLWVTNANPGSTAHGLVITDAVPISTSWAWGGTYANGIVTFTTPSTVAWGSPISMTFAVTVEAPFGFQIVNDLYGVYSTEVPTPTMGIPVTTTVSALDIAINKAGPAFAIVGENIVYTITLDNTGVATATNVVLTDSLPISTTYVADNADNLGWTCPSCALGATDVLTWAVGDVPSDTLGLTFNLTVAVKVSVTSGTVLTNEVQASTDAVGDSLNNNSDYVESTAYTILTVAEARQLAAGEVAAIEGVVSAEPGIFVDFGTNRKLYLQDDSGGILVYRSGGLDDVDRDNKVRVIGEIGEYRTELEMLPDDTSDVTDLGPDTAVSPLVTDTGAISESLEGQLVQITGEIVGKPADYRLQVDDGSGTVEVYRYYNLGQTGDPNYIDFDPFEVGDYIRATGVTRGYDYSGEVRREVLPRGPDDVTELYHVTLMYHDLEDVVGSGEAIYVAGGFNGWNATATPLSANADYSVFSVTVTLDVTGTYEYKYVVYTDTLPSGPANWNWLQTNNRSVEVNASTTAHDYRYVEPGYTVLQWPPATTTNLGSATENIYGQVWADDLTARPGAPRALMAELGYGTAADPSTWATWMAMGWSGQVGNNDEFVGTLTPMASGVYSYVVRFNANWGTGNPNDQWSYGDTDGVHPGDPFEIANAGVLTVTAPDLSVSKDVTPKTGLSLGGVVTYTLVISNGGDGAATSLVMTDALPLGMTFGGWLDQGSAQLPGGDTLTWGPYDVPAGEEYVIQFTATLTTSAAYHGQTITNTVEYASLSAGSGSDDAAFDVIAPAIHIVSPTDGQTFTATNDVSVTLPITISTDNFGIPDDGHWNLWVDGSMVGPVMGYATTADLLVGTHVISAELRSPGDQSLGFVDAVSVEVITAGVPAPDIHIVSPADGQTFTAANNVSVTIPITVSTDNFTIPDDGHWHLWIDGTMIGPVFGYATMADLLVGTHVISAELRSPTHVPLGPVDVVTVIIDRMPSYEIFLPVVMNGYQP